MALSLLFSGFKFRQVEIKIQKYDRYWINVRRIVIRHFSSGIRSQSYDVMSLLNTVYNGRISPILTRERTWLYTYTDRNLASRTILSGNRMHIKCKPLHFHLALILVSAAKNWLIDRLFRWNNDYIRLVAIDRSRFVFYIRGMSRESEHFDSRSSWERYLNAEWQNLEFKSA